MEGKVRNNGRVHALSKTTYDGIPLQRRGTTVEHEDGLDPVEKELADPTEEA
jgi:hypothetical protein